MRELDGIEEEEPQVLVKFLLIYRLNLTRGTPDSRCKLDGT